jgi:hypothetical protein
MIENLSWVRIFDPIHIPEEYIEQIKDRRFSVDKFIQFQKLACMSNVDGMVVLNPLNLLYVLVDEKKITKGFCWMFIDELSESLVINSFSMDKEYWGSGKAVQLLVNKCREIKDGAQLKTVFWITRCPKHSEKYGFKKSKQVLMEFQDGRDNDGIGRQASGQSEPNDKTATAISPATA